MFKKLIYCSSPKEQFVTQKKEILNAINRVLRSDKYILGDEVKNFEKEFAKYVGTNFCIGVNSGTDAIILALKSLDIKVGDEVITTSHTAVATVAAICAVGATPIFVDIEPNYFTINTFGLEKLVNKKTKAIIAVHLYGHPCDMDNLLLISRKFGVKLIEDCSQAHGAKWNDSNLGTFGIISCFSFYPTKNLGAIGDGGALLTNDEKIAKRILSLRQYGWNEKKMALEIGSVSRLDELQAAILRVKLKHLLKSNKKRRIIADMYLSYITNPKIILPKEHPKSYHVYHLFVIRTARRSALIKKFNEAGIFPGIHYSTPVHQHPAYNKFEKNSKRNLPITNMIVNEIVSLPIYPELSFSKIKKVIKIINNFDSKLDKD